MILSFVGDAIVALLLIATIGYSVVLNRRLGSVRSDREKFEVLIRNLNAASQRAEAAVTNLQVTADELSRRLEKKVDEARALSDDLTYMIERGGNIADKLANQIRAGRDELKPDFRPEPKATKPQPPSRDAHLVEPAPRQPPPEPARAEAKPETPRPAFVRKEPRVEPIRVEPVHVEQPVRIEPRVSVPAYSAPAPSAPAPNAPTFGANDTEPALERAAAPSRAERDLLRALAARRR